MLVISRMISRVGGGWGAGESGNPGEMGAGSPRGGGRREGGIRE